MSDNLLGTYEDLAAEYCDPIRHPTCANFHEASGQLINIWLQQFHIEGGWLCEVGPGKSLLAELLAARSELLGQVILVDSSPSMLAYSKQWASIGAHLLLSDAVMLPIASGSLELLVSSLGDPYNEHGFWNEACRVLRPGAISIFTTPSHDWAYAFRGGGDKEMMMSAEFELSDGRCVRVPSWIYPINEQLKMIEDRGLRVKEVAHVPLSALKSGRLSPKLLLERGSDASVVTGYLLTKAHNSCH